MTDRIWPDVAYQGAVAILGTIGAGKSYLAKRAIESELERGSRTCILDPTGAWWGLRSSADGLAPGFPVVVFGGEHGDLPLDEKAGAQVGHLLAARSLQVVLDLSDMSMGGRVRFVTSLLEELYRHNRAPLYLVVDEADLFAPQRPLPDQNVMLNRMENIVRRGRIKGFRPWLITQRPAELHKSVLSQASTLIAMKMTAPQDRDAIGAWIDGQADRDVGKAVLADLPRLTTGQGYIWCPGAGVLEKRSFPRISTFDSSRTPEDGETLEPPARLADVDLAELRDLLAPTVEAAPAPKAKTTAADLAAAEERGYQRGLSEGERREWRRHMEASHAEHMRKLAELDAALAEAPSSAVHTPPVSLVAPAAPPARPRPSPPPATPQSEAGAALTGPQRHVLKSLAWWRAMGKEAPSRNQVAVICGWSTNSSNIRDRCSELARLGLIDRPAAGHLRLTSVGAAAAPRPDMGQTLVESLRRILTNPQQQVFDALLDAGRPMGRDALARAVGWSTSSSNIRDRLSELARLDVIERPSPGVVALQGWVTGG